MPAKLFLPTDAMEVSSLVVLIYGSPGSWKTSVAQTADSPFTLDFDRGMHRSKYRKVGARIDSWFEAEQVFEMPEYKAAKTIVVDTVGRLLDYMSADIIAGNHKLGSKTGGLSLQGFGSLKARFAQWMAALRLQGSDLVLVAHDREEKDGDDRLVRPDIAGGSYAEVMKFADLAGFLRIVNGKRVLDFNPTDRSIGKNAVGWKAMEVPELGSKPRFLGELIAEAKSRIGQVSAESAEMAKLVDEWRAAIDAFAGADEFTAAVTKLEALPPVVKAQVKVLLWDAAKGKHLAFDKAKKAFAAGGAA